LIEILEDNREKPNMGRSGTTARGSTGMAKTSPVEFFQQVRQEVSRVTWPTRKETMVTTGMVFVMVFIAAAFFFVVDQAFSAGVRLIFGLGH
jgi:preprotein translocase subunit SecE